MVIDMLLRIERTSLKKRRWRFYCAASELPWLSEETCNNLEKIIFKHNERARILKEKLAVIFIMHVEFKNDADEAAFMLWASDGIVV